MYIGPNIKRQKFVTVLLALGWLVLWGRIGMIQCFKHDFYLERAINQRIKPVTMFGARGRILDRNGAELAVNVPSASYGIRPREIGDTATASFAIASAAGIDAGGLRRRLDASGQFFWVVRNADYDVVKTMDALDVQGLEKVPEMKRSYPLGMVAGQLLGYTDVDGKGIEGCEIFAEYDLAGREGKGEILRDAKGLGIESMKEPLVKPLDGLDVVLTIDSRIQEIAEQELERGVRETNAIWGGVVVVDSSTGEILAMANAPRFDPNDPSSVDPAVRRNRIVTDRSEPGSTYKVVTFIEALESGVIGEDDLIDCEEGSYRIARHTINDTHEMGIVPARDVFVHSSNIGTAKIAELIGKQNLYERSRMLGFGSVTGVDFPNDSPGELPHPRTWSKLTLPTISYGQGVAASHLQTVMAYAAIANGGLLLRPRLIKEVVGTEDRPGRMTETRVIRRAMSEETSRRMCELLRETVETGTGMTAALPNVVIGGKTGTAQRVMEGGRGYEPGKYISSFAGMTLSREPRIVCLVIIDSPVGVYYGSQIAAPVFSRIMNRAMNLKNNPWNPQIAAAPDTGKARRDVPALAGSTVREAASILKKIGGGASAEEYDVPEPVRSLSRSGQSRTDGDMIDGSRMIVGRGDSILVPDLVGKTVREAVLELVDAELKVQVQGAGVVNHQDPRPGTTVPHGTVCLIACGKR